MTSIPVRDDLIRSIEKLANEQGTDTEALVNAWLERQLALEREQRIFEETERFQAQHSALLPIYAGQYIAMHNGVVVDHAESLTPLYERIRARFGDEPVLITPVTTEPIQTFNRRSWRFAKSTE
jgi:hypothetical protein